VFQLPLLLGVQYTVSVLRVAMRGLWVWRSKILLKELDNSPFVPFIGEATKILVPGCVPHKKVKQL